jgi:putative Mg2+ transporter-C (MgtC) family protein
MIVDPTFVVFGKLLLAAVLGMVIGTERALVNKGAGTRTYALVALGSCLLILMSASVIGQNPLGGFDPLRVAAAVVGGVGFLGAGAIMIRNETISGVTTAAGLWVASAVGMTVAYSLYAMATFTTILTLFIFTAVWYFEDTLRKKIGVKTVATDTTE